MRILLGLIACMLGGCVAQPVQDPSTDALRLALAADVPHVLRIGLEHLPPDERLPRTATVRAEPVPRATARTPLPAGSRPRGLTDLEGPSRAPRLDRIDFSSIDDPIARETLVFIGDMVETDRLRVRREVGIPFFDFRQDDAERGPLMLLRSEQVLLEDHEQWVQDNGGRLLRRPFRRLLRRLPVVQDVEIEMQEFRGDHVPLTEPYRQVHGDRRRLGRMSLRLNAGDLGDPVEVAWVHSGVRVGTSQDRGRLSIDLPLSDTMHFELRAQTRYSTSDVDLRADLIFQPSTHMSLHLAVGDDMDFLSTTSIYSLFESPMDGSPGLVLYAVHTF